MVRFYLDIISLIKTYLVVFDTTKLVGESDFVNDYYKLMDNDGNRIKNPIVLGSKIKLSLPIAKDILDVDETNNYVNDQLSIINSIIYEAGVASLLDVTLKEESNDKDFIIIVLWEIKFKPLIISSSIWLLLLSLFGLFIFLV